MDFRKISFNNGDLDALFNYGKNDYFYNAYGGEKENLNCLVDNSILIEGISFYERNENSFSVDVRNNNTPIIIKSCVFESELNISGSGNNGSIIFDNVSFKGNLITKNRCNNFKLINCQNPFSFNCASYVLGDFTLCNNVFKSLSINCISSNIIIIEKIKVFETFTFTGNVRNKVDIQSINCNKFALSGLNLEYSFKLHNNSEINELFFSKAIFNDEFIISKSTFGEVNFSEATFKKELLIDSSSFKKNVKLSFGRNLMKAKILDNSIFYSLLINGILSIDSSLKITNSLFKEISFEDFKNNGILKLTDVRMDKSGKLKIRHSSLGKAEIYNSNFSNTRFEFEKSQINEIFISETDFPEYVSRGNSRDFGQGQLAFGQLQTVFQRQGDSVRSYEYLAREIQSYYKQLSFFSNKFFTKLNLFLNRISNDFGRNWILGFIFSF